MILDNAFRLMAFGALLLVSTFSAQAEKRVALVIGNSSYGQVPKLTNPANDAEAMGILLKSAGFEVVELRRDLGIVEMRRAVNDFSDLTQNAETAVVFYAGHGIEVDGVNYLVPVDAKLGRDLDVEDETVSLDRILRVLEPAKRLRLVILDACRDNPFAKTMKRTVASRSVGRGLGRVEPSTSDTLIAFAAKAGSTAADGDGIHSPFTAALLRHLATPGLDVRLAFGQVRDDVMKATRKRQEPFVYGSLGGGVVTLASLSTGEGTQPNLADPNAVAARDYEAAGKLDTKDAWNAFLALHPAGFYADLARGRLKGLIPTSPPPSATPKANINSESKKSKKTATLPPSDAPSSRDERGKGIDFSKVGGRTKYCNEVRREVARARGGGITPFSLDQSPMRWCGVQ